MKGIYNEEGKRIQSTYIVSKENLNTNLKEFTKESKNPHMKVKRHL